MNNTPGQRIRELRKYFQLSQEKFGQLAGMTKAAVSQWECEKVIPERDALLELQHTRAVSPLWIARGEGERFLKPQPRIKEDAEAYNHGANEQLPAYISPDELKLIEALRGQPEQIRHAISKIINGLQRPEQKAALIPAGPSDRRAPATQESNQPDSERKNPA